MRLEHEQHSGSLDIELQERVKGTMKETERCYLLIEYTMGDFQGAGFLLLNTTGEKRVGIWDPRIQHGRILIVNVGKDRIGIRTIPSGCSITRISWAID